MGLTADRKKRALRKGREPKNTTQRAAHAPRFFVQRHETGTLQADFRLELGGVLKSWSIPKGPSMNPVLRRLAVQTGDLPLNEHTLRGKIPGADDLVLWDEGTCEATGASDAGESRKMLEQGFGRGKLSITLHGGKLKGAFTLIRLNSESRKSWLLMKKNDEFARRDEKDETPASGPGRHRVVPSEADRPRTAEPRLTKKRETPDSSRLLKLPGRTVEISHPGKLYWPDEGITKMDLVEYYRRISPVLLPHLKDRPHALHRHPNGAGQPGFFQKNLLRGIPDWVTTVTVQAESTGRNVRYFVCTDEASLILMINMGCIEINPWFSRVGSLDRPDFLVFDLDPLDTGFPAVVEVARALKEILDRADIPSVPKTSGATGMHIYVPLEAAYDYPTVRDFAELVVRLLHEQMPEATSLERNPLLRKKKVYLDYLRNSFTQTLAAPYSVRPRPGAPVSTPLEWKEVGPGLDPRQHTIKTLPRRLDAKGDLFRRVLGKGISLETARKKLSPGRASARRSGE